MCTFFSFLIDEKYNLYYLDSKQREQALYQQNNPDSHSYIAEVLGIDEDSMEKWELRLDTDDCINYLEDPLLARGMDMINHYLKKDDGVDLYLDEDKVKLKILVIFDDICKWHPDLLLKYQYKEVFDYMIDKGKGCYVFNKWEDAMVAAKSLVEAFNAFFDGDFVLHINRNKWAELKQLSIKKDNPNLILRLGVDVPDENEQQVSWAMMFYYRQTSVDQEPYKKLSISVLKLQNGQQEFNWISNFKDRYLIEM